MAMACHGLTSNVVVEHVERREERRRSIPLVIVSHRSAPTLLDRQAGLCAVESLNLRLLVGAEHERMLRRIQIEPDHVDELLNEMGVVADLERTKSMRLQTVCFPDAVDQDVINLELSS